MSDGLLPWAMLSLAVAATFAWRFVGVLIAGRLREDDPLFDWVSAVAYAMVAGLMLRIIVFPTNAMADAPLLDRLTAFAVALLVWYFRGRALMQGLFAGVAVFAAFVLLREGGVL